MSFEDVVNGKKLKWIELEIMVMICNLSLLLWWLDFLIVLFLNDNYFIKIFLEIFKFV